VYCARDPQLNREVAIKASKPHINDRFERNVRAIGVTRPVPRAGVLKHAPFPGQASLLTIRAAALCFGIPT